MPQRIGPAVATVAVCSRGGPLDSKVRSLLAADEAFDRVVAVAPDSDLEASFGGVDCVVYLSWTPLVRAPEPSLSVDLDLARRVLDAAGACGVA